MTSPREDGRFEVPIERLPGGRGQARRAGTVAAAVAAVLVGAYGIARLSDGGPGASSPPGASGAAAARPSGAASTRSTGSAGPRIEHLPAIPAVLLPGAPETAVLDRVGAEGTDLRVTAWTPADARTRTIEVIPGVFDRDDPSPVAPVIAPDRAHVLLLGTSSDGALGLDGASVIDATGRSLWTADHVTPGSGAVWSADSRLVVVAGQPRRWHLVELDRAGRATDHLVTLPFEVYVPQPVPHGWLTFSSVEPRTIPLGFSADGSWIYGGVISPELGMLIGQFRVARDGSRVEALPDFGVGKADGLVPRPGTVGAQYVDPATGRVATSRINADTTGGPRALEVRSADSGFQFVVAEPATLGAAWAGDGALVTLSGDNLIYPDALELRLTGEDGTAGPPILATGPLTTGALVGVRDGFAVVALLAARPSIGMQLVAVDLAHPERITALTLDPAAQVLGVSIDH
ncbi:MAG TPA: hypothetical protein VFI34_11585 [Candidatus Limnocylindrales bacterium]|nr:hypothetical protein [Candidatus Limnocylindrales bacterium]